MTENKSSVAKNFISSISSPKLWISFSIGIALAVILILQVPLDDLATGLAKVSIPLFIAALPCRLASNLVRTLRFAYFFPADGKALRMFSAIALSRISNYVVPFRIVGGTRLLRLFGTFALIRVTNYMVPFRLGEVVSVVLLKKLGFSPSIAETTPIWIFFRLCDFVGLALIAASVLMITVVPSGIEDAMVFSLIAIVGGFVLVVVATPTFVRLIETRQWFQRHRWFRLKYESVKAGLDRIKSVKAFAVALTGAILVWAANLSGSVLALFAFGAPLTIVEATLAAVLVTLVGLLPIRPPLGLGVTDVLWVSVLSLLGVDLDQAIILAIGTRLAVLAAVLLDALLSSLILLQYQIATKITNTPEPGKY